ncbi:hypothetical protein BJ878DRAFT_510403 [Calycina marina]|uniref:Uncharacterized protein n=1 Tax=Calycina marina TaxID=1763456 RepID=A0A9P7Z0V2_9HELO|nr:hypothetical protein BJ878DRAFT_510403 [Calycina marina]
MDPFTAEYHVTDSGWLVIVLYSHFILLTSTFEMSRRGLSKRPGTDLVASNDVFIFRANRANVKLRRRLITAHIMFNVLITYCYATV